MLGFGVLGWRGRGVSFFGFERGVGVRFSCYAGVSVYVFFPVFVLILNSNECFVCESFIFDLLQKKTENVVVGSLVNEEYRQNREYGSLSQSRLFLRLFRYFLFGFRVWIFATDAYSGFISVKFGF